MIEAGISYEGDFEEAGNRLMDALDAFRLEVESATEGSIDAWVDFATNAEIAYNDAPVDIRLAHANDIVLDDVEA